MTLFSQRLDWFLLADDNLLDPIVDEICKDLDNERIGNRRIQISRKQERLSCNLIINSLYQGFFSIPPTQVSLPLRSFAYTGSNVGYRHIKKVYDFLKKTKLIKVKLGSEFAKKYSRIFPTKKLQLKFKKIGLKWRLYSYADSYNPIVLRDKKESKGKLKGKLKAKDLPVPNNSTTNEYKTNLNRINRYLLKNCIALNVDDNARTAITKHFSDQSSKFKTQESHYSLNYSNVCLRRIFSRGSLELGGRFYGGWWQLLPKKYRPYITIGRKRTSEVDFSTMSLRILYAWENIDIPDNRDLYDIGLSGSDRYLEKSRDLIKTYTNAILNDDSGNFRLNKADLTTLKLSHNELKSRVYEFHKPIIKYFSTGVGLKTMLIDSQIAEKIMLYYLYDNVVVLPIHDSFIIRAGFETDLENTMKRIFYEVVGSKTKVKSVGGLRSEYFGNSPGLSNEDPSYEVVSAKDTLEEILRPKSSIYDKYLNSWELWQNSNYKDFYSNH
tara:strand:+ start:1164 stop:2651 length:1488 start_codon:yes stop_codon:yes gene_type:complete